MFPSAGSTTVTTTTTVLDDEILTTPEASLSFCPPHNYIAAEDIRIQINGKWLDLSKEFVANHPGGSVINQYRNTDATHMFHAFHEGSTTAYKQLKLLEKNAATAAPPAQLHNNHSQPLQQQPRIRTLSSMSQQNNSALAAATTSSGTGSPDDLVPNVGRYDFSIEKEMKIVESFEQLRQHVHREGLMDARPWFYVRKVVEVLALMSLSVTFQCFGWYLCSALALAVCWQQSGWLTHEFCHHQPLKRRAWNDAVALLFGNVVQGFSRDWWKDKHNTHHAATNIIDQDGDIDLAPLVAMVPQDLRKYREPLERQLLKIVPYQHLYFTFVLPLLRPSWTSQSVIHVFTARQSQYRKDRLHATAEQVTLTLHYAWVFLQLYYLPNMTIRLTFFLVSQLLGGLLIALVVTYNHNSVDKFPENSRLLNNFAALHILTTRNMKPSPFVDWLWGGLNYQIEHHLFPTMPRPNLARCSQLVREFCAENGLPYLVDDYWTGYAHSLRLLKNVADIEAAKQRRAAEETAKKLQ